MAQHDAVRLRDVTQLAWLWVQAILNSSKIKQEAILLNILEMHIQENVIVIYDDGFVVSLLTPRQLLDRLYDLTNTYEGRYTVNVMRKLIDIEGKETKGQALLERYKLASA